MFEFHKYLQQSERYPDEVPHFIESAPWEMAVALNRYLRDIGEYSEIIVPNEERTAPVYVKVNDKLYSSLGEEDAKTLNIGWKVISEDSMTKYAKKHVNEMGREIREANLVISRSVERAIIEIIKRGPKNCDPDLFEVKMLRATQQGFDIKRIMYHETEKKNALDIRIKGFDLDKVGARGSDETMPDGVFVKPTSGQIDVAMEPVQMPMLLRKGKTKSFISRESLEEFLKDDFAYKELAHMVSAIDDSYNVISDNFQQKLIDTLASSGRRSDEVKSVRAEFNAMLDVWRDEIKVAATNARERATAVFKEQGFDMVRIEQDQGSFGRVVDTTIILNPDNIRSLQDSFVVMPRTEYEPESLSMTG